MAVIVDSPRAGDRSAGDRRRHKELVREAIRENIADTIADHSIIGRSPKEIIRVPIKAKKEPAFHYGSNSNRGVAPGKGSEKAGDVIGDLDEGIGEQGRAGDQPGDDIYETEIDLELGEILEMMFEDLELPNQTRKFLKETVLEKERRPAGYRRYGIRPRLSKKKTIQAKAKRLSATKKVRREMGVEEEKESLIIENDLRYKKIEITIKPDSNAVIFLIMDTSGSMGMVKKYYARIFCFLFYSWIIRKYYNIDLVFIAHTTDAKVVDEDHFFHRGESGGTMISSGPLKVLELVRQKYDPALFDIYAFHCSDGDNWPQDNKNAVEAYKKLCEIAARVGFGEINPEDDPWPSPSEPMGDILEREIRSPEFKVVRITNKEEIWPAVKELLKENEGGSK